MKIKKGQLWVFYHVPIDTEFDRAITAFFEERGWEWVGQGVEIETGARDISFERKNK